MIKASLQHYTGGDNDTVGDVVIGHRQLYIYTKSQQDNALTCAVPFSGTDALRSFWGSGGGSVPLYSQSQWPGTIGGYRAESGAPL